LSGQDRRFIGSYLPEVVEKTLNHFGRIDILVNNAGIIRRTPALEHSIVDWDVVLEVNLSSAFQLCQLVG
jgi:2-dehydro-3-deoxy-D-gluconate 5-dehydrogenase